MLINESGRNILLTLITVILSVFITGGNHTTVLVTSELMTIIVLLMFMKKHKQRVNMLIVFLFLIVGMMINVFAPGNAGRLATGNGENPFRAIIDSVFYSFINYGKWTKIPQLIYLAIISPIVILLVRKCNWLFKYPAIVFIISFGIFSSQMTPCLYALSYVGSGRQLNIYYFAYYILISFNLFYMCGWIFRKKIAFSNWDIILEKFRTRLPIYSSVLIIPFLFSCYFEYGSKNTSIDIVKSIATGELYQYDKIMSDNEHILTESENIAVISNPLKTPCFMPELGAKEDDSYWVNVGMARYYGLKSVKISDK